MKITTNNVPRLLIDAYQLTEKERKEFDYHDWDKIDKGEDSATFFRYRGDLYDLATFERVERGGDLESLGWQGHKASSYFSATLVRYAEDTDYVVVAYATW